MNTQLAYETVLREFMNLAQIPRPSHHEEKVSAYLYQWALDHGLAVQKDELGEIFIDKPASPGCEACPKVLFQAHMDMVCVAEEHVAYDPLNDPIRVINNGDTLTADGTSLGADDGIGVALCLYILQDNDLKHGPIRVVLTTNEEDGMDSMNMDPNYLDGDFLINLDWETLGSLCNSCAGGDFFNFSRTPDWQAPPPGCQTMVLSFRDLLGGHSGVGINKGHANALVCMATALTMLSQAGISYSIAAFHGGQAKNAIAAAATVELAINTADLDAATAILEQFSAQFREAYGNIEPEYSWTVMTHPNAPQNVLSAQTSADLASLMAVVPNNVHTMSPFVDGLVESSSNLGVITLDEHQLCFTVFARSSVPFPETQLGVICQALAPRFGFAFTAEGHVTGWAVNPNSRLVPITCQAYQKLTGEPMIVEPVHAGVECGAFAEKNPKLDMIAIGPTLTGVHTPDEVCHLSDIHVTTELLVEVLERLTEV